MTPTLLHLIYVLVIFAIVYAPTHASTFAPAMDHWWFRLAFLVSVLWIFMRIDQTLGLFCAILFVGLNRLHPKSIADA